jgi:predicted phage terminase large subunit-like protein
MSRDLMLTNWYQERWGSKFTFSRDAEHFFSNDRGGVRLATSPESKGTGYHGDRILLDDALRASDVTKAALDQVNDWYDGTVTSRGIGPEHARVIIMQRLHENDIAAHVLEHEPWEVLCLPERYERDHPYAWRGDSRSEGQLLWPDYRPPSMSDAQSKGLRHRAAGQMQQRPAPREGNILKRHWWRFYDPAILTDPNRKPRFNRIIQSIDTPLKDKESNDLVSIQAWGVKGADRFLLDIRTEHMNYNQAKRAIIEQARYVRKLYPRVGHKVLIENAGYGVELLIDLKRILTGVTKVNAGQDGNKVMRAESAADDLESGNCWLPGIGGGVDETMGPARIVSANITAFIESCAVFDNGEHDDDVDAWSQCMNWLRSSPTSGGRTASPFKRRRTRAAA